MSTPKTDEPQDAIAWSEEVWFRECPACGTTHDMGSGVHFNEGSEAECEKCEQLVRLRK